MSQENRSASQTRRLVICALMAAMGAVLGGLINIPVTLFGAYSLKIGFGALPTLLAAILYGPIAGGMVGAVADLTQAFLFPKGAYMPLFTLVAALSGVIPGLFFRYAQEARFPRVFFAVLAGQLVCSAFLNTVVISVLYGLPFLALLAARLINQAVMIPLYALILTGLMRAFEKSSLLSTLRRE